MSEPTTKSPSVPSVPSVVPTLLRRREVIEALRRGTVPRRGLELFAIGMERFEKLDEEFDSVAAGRGIFKALRGDFGCGKTFAARWLQRRAQNLGLATAEVQISENDTPLHKLETVYRRAMESLATKEWERGSFPSLIESWFFSLEQEVFASGVRPDDEKAVTEAVGALLEGRLKEVSAIQPQFAAALRACHTARVKGDNAEAEGLMAWLMGQPNVGADIKRRAGIKGDLDHTGALAFLRGVLTVLRQTGRGGLMLVLDEVETIQRVKADSREKSLNALRQFVDYLYDQHFPGLYVLITGTPAFFDGAQGIRRAEALAMRIHVDFSGDPKFDNTRDAQIRLLPFDHAKLVEVGRRVREIYPSRVPERIAERVTDDVIDALARGVSGKFGGKTGVAPRIFLRKLVCEILDKVDEHEDYDPKFHFKLVVEATEMTAEEREAAGRSVDDIDIDVGKEGENR
jgi:hypothetical protein